MVPIEKVKIKIKRAGLQDLDVEGEPDWTVLEFKEQLTNQVHIPVNHIRLVCEGKVWSNNFSLRHYIGSSEGKEVHCLKYIPTEETQPQITPNALQADEEVDPFASIMQSEMMQNMLSNPETLRSLMRMNPNFQQLLEQQPEMARIFDDPEILQQSIMAMTNPSVKREMMRQADRSMSNLETIPGGHSALRRMHNEFSDPLYEAMTGSSRGDAPAQQYEQNTDGPMSSAPLPNPWAASNPAPTPGAGAAGVPGANPFAALGGLGGMGGLGGLNAGSVPAAPAGGATNTTPPPLNPFLASMGGQPTGATGTAAGNTTTPPINPLLAAFGGNPSAAPGNTGSPNTPAAPALQPLLAALSGNFPATGSTAQPNGTSNPTGPTPFSVFPMANIFQMTGGVDDEPGEPIEGEIQLKVNFTGRIIKVNVKNTETVLDMKTKLQPKLNLRTQYIRLIRERVIWENEKTIESYNVPANAEIFALKYVPTGETDLGPPPAAAAAAPTGAPDMNPILQMMQNMTNPQNAGTTPAPNPFMGMGGMGGAAGTPNPFMAMGGMGGAAGAPNPFAGLAGMGGNAGAPNPFAGLAGMGEAAGAPNPFMGMGGGAGFQPGNQPAATPVTPAMMPMYETRFRNELAQLAEMGFTDKERCINILIQMNGDVTRALDQLLGSM